MKVPLLCTDCIQENGQHREILKPFQESNVYSLECSKGHKSYTCLQEQKFEILSEIALDAICKGFHREAVATFSSCLERFYEFYIWVICLVRDTDPDGISRAWKQVKNSSERQLGAYIFLSLTTTKMVPDLLTEKEVSFRNGVIHKGKIPTRADTIQYGKRITGMIFPQLVLLKTECPDEVGKVVHEHISQTRRTVPNGENPAFLSMRTLLNIASCLNENIDFDERLSRNAISLRRADL